MPDLFGARAATQGNEIHFPRGQYQPETAEGRRILKHEMRHTIQQTKNEVTANVDGIVNNEKGKEAEADRGFEGVKMSGWNSCYTVSMGLNNSPIQCCGGATRFFSEEELRQYVVEQASEKAKEIREKQSRTKAGPCLSTVYDPVLNQIYFGQNFQSGNATEYRAYQKWLREEAHPIIQTRTEEYQSAIDRGEVPDLTGSRDIRLAAHSEIRALEASGKSVDERTISEMYLHNIDLRQLYRAGEINFKKRCENCKRITDGIKVLGDESD